MFGTRRQIAIQPSSLLIPLNRLLAKFPGGDEVVLQARITGPDVTWDMFQSIGSRLYFKANIRAQDFTVGQNHFRIFENGISELYRAFTINSTPALTNSGPFAYSASTTYIGGGFHYSSVTGNYLQLTTEAGASYVGAACAAAFTGGGLFLVTIDGSTTLADLLPTAQDLVTGGSMPNTILIANGGTLNPTDRVWDTYNRTSSNPTGRTGYVEIFTRSLAAGVHTVRLTVTGYKNVAAGVQFNGILAILSGGPGHSGATGRGAGVDIVFVTTPLVYATSCWEISWSTKPAGAVAYEWVGHSGSLKIRTLPTVTVDGVAVTPTNGSINTGTEIIITTQNNARHSETGVTNIGILDLSFTMNKTTGLTIAHSLAWAVNGVANSYPCMMDVLHSQFDRFTTLGVVGSGDLTLNNDSVNYNTSDQAGYCWKNGGYIAMLMYIPSLAYTVDNWADAPTNRLWWADVSANAGAWKKLYTTRFQADKAFTAATVWQSLANYRLMYNAAGVSSLFPV